MTKGADVNSTSRPALQILPFENLGSSDDEYFVNGMAEDLASRLAGVQILSIAGPTDMSFVEPGYEIFL